MSKRQCRNTPGCEYDAYEGCISSDDSYDNDFGYEVDNDECSGLSRRMCRSTTGCEYSRLDGCVSSGSEDDYQGGMNNNNGESEVEELTPPKPDMDPPKGWSKMKSTRSPRGGDPGMHTSCACMYPFPRWIGMEGGFWCFCI